MINHCWFIACLVISVCVVRRGVELSCIHDAVFVILYYICLGVLYRRGSGSFVHSQLLIAVMVTIIL